MDTLKQQLAAIQEGGAVGGTVPRAFGDSQTAGNCCNCIGNSKSVRTQKLINDLQMTANNAEKHLR